MYAFRCANCNSLEEAAHAGENAIPRRCRTCGKGGSFDPNTGIFTTDPANWIVLADLSKADLKPILDYHAIDAADITRHEPGEPGEPRTPRLVEASATETVETGDVAK